MFSSKRSSDGCEPISIWGIYRHGKIYPNAAVVQNMKDALPIKNLITSSYEKHHSSLCAQDVENLKNWNIPQKFFDGKQELADEGAKEMIGLGKRLKEAFPILLSNIRDGDYSFRSAKGPSIEESIKYFVAGLGKNLITEKVKLQPDVMAPYTSLCDSKNVPNYTHIYEESEKFLNTSDYLIIKDRIQRRTGIEVTLSDLNITALYDLCRYTWSAVDNNASPWCALFTTDDLQVLEYVQDLKHYYRSGYGTHVNEIIGRVPLGDLFENFEKAKNAIGKKIVAYVTRAAMLDQIYTSLGIFKDHNPLTALNRDRERKWRTSKLSVFSANLVAVLNRCTDKNSTDHNVVFYLNEEPIRSICEEGVCSWNEFETKLRPFMNTNMDFCELKSETL